MVSAHAESNEPAAPIGDGGLVRLRLDISYDGTDFSGWARQTDLRTVCGEIEDKLGTVLRRPVQLTVAGRTDAGVHATGQVAHVDVPGELLPDDPSRLVRRLARFLPKDVRVKQISVVPGDFDARFSAMRRSSLALASVVSIRSWRTRFAARLRNIARLLEALRSNFLPDFW